MNQPKLICTTPNIIGGVSPHAGYTFSGRCAAFTYLNLFKERIPDTVIVLGTDHVGYGKVALLGDGAWETPLGNLQIDDELSNGLCKVIFNIGMVTGSKCKKTVPNNSMSCIPKKFTI